MRQMSCKLFPRGHVWENGKNHAFCRTSYALQTSNFNSKTHTRRIQETPSQKLIRPFDLLLYLTSHPDVERHLSHFVDYLEDINDWLETLSIGKEFIRGIQEYRNQAGRR